RWHLAHLTAGPDSRALGIGVQDSNGSARKRVKTLGKSSDKVIQTRVRTIRIVSIECRKPTGARHRSKQTNFLHGPLPSIGTHVACRHKRSRSRHVSRT